MQRPSALSTTAEVEKGAWENTEMVVVRGQDAMLY